MPMTVEDMLAACIPGGSVCDPQQVADAIRAWYAEHPAAADAQGDAMDRIMTYAKELRASDAAGEAANWRREYDELMSRKPEGADAGAQDVEVLAEMIYSEAMRFHRIESTPDWVPNGNSVAQDVARKIARRLTASAAGEQSLTVDASAQQPSAKDSELPDPDNCRACTHPDCGRYNGPRIVECRAMQFGACAREFTFNPEAESAQQSAYGHFRDVTKLIEGETNAQQPAHDRVVPEAMPDLWRRHDDPEKYGYARGWNACREAMLAAAVSQQPAERERVELPDGCEILKTYIFPNGTGYFRPVVQVMLPRCKVDDNGAWKSRDIVAEKIRALLAVALKGDDDAR